MQKLSTRHIAVGAAVLGLLWSGMASGAAVAPPEPKTHTVTIDAMRFQPEVLTVAPGDAIVWVNKDPFPHTATSPAGGFDSREIATGASWKHTAAKKGEFEYVCTLHPTMRGTLRVE